METNKIFMDVAQRAREFAEMCERMANETKQKSDPEAWREECRKKQAAGVRFEVISDGGNWHKGNSWKFDGNKEYYREVPLEQPAIGVISSFNKWDRVLTEKEISDLFSGKVRPEDIPQEVSAECQNALEYLAKTYSADKGTAQLNPTIPPHAAERALWKAQRDAGTNEVWQFMGIGNVWLDCAECKEPEWLVACQYHVKPMKLTAKIIRRGVYKTSYYWEFFGTREEYRAECEKYGYAVISEIKEVVEKPKTVTYYFAMLNRYRCTPFGRAASDKDQIIEYAKKHCYTIIGDIEEREVEA